MVVRALVQRVTRARVVVATDVVGEIGPGLLVFVGVTHDDDRGVAIRVAEKVANLRVFADGAGVMNRSVLEIGGEALVVSQFTLYGDASRGRRPSWIAAAPPEVAAPLVDAFVEHLRDRGLVVETGVFGADMQVELTNDGPVTLSVQLEKQG